MPELVVPDNLKSGVAHAHRYEPVLNRTYQDLAQHYGVAIRPARAVRHALDRTDRFRSRLAGLDGLGLWAFGFDADNMKIRAWQSSRFPLITGDADAREDVHDLARQLVESTGYTAGLLKEAIKRALYGSPSQTGKGKTSWDYPQRLPDDRKLGERALFAEAETQLWADTQDAFFDALRRASGGPGELFALKRDWLQTLQRTALSLFDGIARPDQQHRANPAAVSLARAPLRKIPSLPRLIDTLGLDAEPAYA